MYFRVDCQLGLQEVLLRTYSPKPFLILSPTLLQIPPLFSIIQLHKRVTLLSSMDIPLKRPFYIPVSHLPKKYPLILPLFHILLYLF